MTQAPCGCVELVLAVELLTEELFELTDVVCRLACWFVELTLFAARLVIELEAVAFDWLLVVSELSDLAAVDDAFTELELVVVD